MDSAENPVRQAWEAVANRFRRADSATVGVSAWVVSYQVTRTKDGVWFAGGGLARPLSVKDMQFNSAGIDFTADFIEDGGEMSETKRSGIVGGTSIAFKGCYVVCAGRSWSATEKGLVGTNSFGIGTPGVAFGGGHMWEIGSGGNK